MNSNSYSGSLKFKIFFFLFYLFLLTCKKGTIENFYFEYFNLKESAEYLSNTNEQALIHPLKDTLLEEGNFKKLIFLDEIKMFKKENDFLYELKKVRFHLQDIELDAFIVPLLSFFPFDGEKVKFKYEKLYILGSDTLYFSFKREIRIDRNEKNYNVNIYDLEINEFSGNKEEKRDTLYMLLEPQRLPLIIKKGGKKWIRKN